jgi:holliday junction DNA helicase RuvA
MIAALHGCVTHYDPETATAWVDVAGVWYEVRVPAFAGEWFSALVGADEPTTIYTYYHVSERNPQPLLVGFQHRAERDFFRKFIEVPDVGPTKAVRALTRPVSEIARWIEAGDVKSIRLLPGIGERLSQTIVARLAGKLTLEALLRDGESVTPSAEAVPSLDALREDAVEALVSLQYTRRDAEVAVDAALAEHPSLDSLEALLRAVFEREAPAEAAS